MKNKKLLIIIFLLVLLVSGITFIFTKIEPDEDVKQNNYLEDELKFVSAFTIVNVCTPKISFDFDNDNKLEYKDLSYEFIINSVYNYLYGQGKIEKRFLDNNVMESFTKKDFINGFNVIFGSNNKLELPESLTIMDEAYTYNYAKENYSVYKDNNDCENTYRSLYYLYDVDSNYEEIILKVAFYYPIFSGKDIYASANFLSEEKICLEKEIPNNLEYFKKFQFNIKKVKGDYQFDSISLID